MGSNIRRGTWLVLLAALCILCLGRPAAADSGASNARLNKKVDDLHLVDTAGKNWALSDLYPKKAVVVVFLSFECPVSTSYTQLLAELANHYGKLGVAFVGICSSGDDAQQVARLASGFKLPFAVFADPAHVAADALKAEVTPEAFALDLDRVLRYRGRIDDAYAARLRKNQKVSHEDLRRALDEMLDRKPVSAPVTKAIGCPIPRDTGMATSGSVTFYRDVLPILQNRCQACHRPGGAAPFALQTYRQASSWAKDIKEFTRTKQMPPWKLVEGPGFRDDRTLSQEETVTLAAWADGGRAAGDVRDAPPARQFTDGWQLGTPDLVVSVPAEFQLGPTGPDHFRIFVLPTNLSEDKFVRAVEVRPGNARIVHHAILFMDANGMFRRMEEDEKQRPVAEGELDRGPGFAGFMGGLRSTPRLGQQRPRPEGQPRPSEGQERGGQRRRGPGFPALMGVWAPGQIPKPLPDGIGHRLPKGSDLVMQVHYNRSGRLEKDRTTIGVYFAKKPVDKPVQDLLLLGRLLFIPPGVERHKVEGSLYVGQDCTVHSVFPHMHLIGKEIRITMTPPGGQMQTLAAIKDWDFNWQETYFFKEPIRVKAGTRFDIEGYFDNSANNPRNPNQPPRLVIFGQQTSNEMCVAVLEATSEKPGRIQMRFGPQRREAKADAK